MSWTEEEDKQAAKNVAPNPSDKESFQEINPNQEIWTLLKETLAENVAEKRRARRWKIFFRFVTLAIMIGVLVSWITRVNMDDIGIQGNTVAIIPMQGIIGAESDIESSEMVSLLDQAFRTPQLQGVVIELNSPGGSPFTQESFTMPFATNKLSIQIFQLSWL